MKKKKIKLTNWQRIVVINGIRYIETTDYDLGGKDVQLEKIEE